MRSSALTMASLTRQHIAEHGYPDLVFCTDMLDLPSWRGIVNDKRVAELPVVTYFHESQWTYPVAPHSRADHHFGYTNLLSAIASNVCLFNSNFHRETFLNASESFIRKMPDSKSWYDWKALRLKSSVIPAGFDPPAQLPFRCGNDVPVIGWVSRWESDKSPEQFAEILKQLKFRGYDFRLVLLGGRSGSNAKTCEALDQIRLRHGEQILFDGYAQSGDEYWQWLSKMDFVVSTAAHEFFGIGICEAMHAGAVPVVPNRLSYPELVPSECLYETTDEAIGLLYQSQAKRAAASFRCKHSVMRFDRKLMASEIDRLAIRLARTHHHQ